MKKCHLVYAVFYFLCLNSVGCEVEYAYACLAAVSVMDCWKNHYNIPSCTGKSAMMRCAEEESSTVDECRDDKIIEAVENMLEDFEVAEDALCDNKKLKQDFQSNNFCWSQARTCGFELVTPALDEDSDEDNCDQKKARLDVCMTDVPSGCRMLVHNYTDYIYNHSTCGGSAIIAQITLIAAIVVGAMIFERNAI